MLFLVSLLFVAEVNPMLLFFKIILPRIVSGTSLLWLHLNNPLQILL